MNVDKIQLHNEYREILKLLPQIEGEPEMSEFDSAFLCGILRKFTPRKVLEVGIAGGGTTAIIEKCLCEINDNFELYSIDISEEFYRDNKLKSGHLGIELDNKLMKTNNYTHKYLYGNVACSFSDVIGGEIDCLILDTVHSMPGELLDFLSLLPFLKEGCVVVLHDIVYNHTSRDRLKSEFSNILLFSAVSGNKYINNDETSKKGIANIAAFTVDKSTRDNIGDLFLALLVYWKYMPEERFLLEYKRIIKEYYNSYLNRLFDAAIELNRCDIIVRDKRWQFPFYWIPENAKVVIYGAGNVGKEFVFQIKKQKSIKIVKWVDQNYCNIAVPWVENVDVLLSVHEDEYDCIVIAVENKSIAEEIKKQLIIMGLPEQKILWRNPLSI